jgi:hypothetical protein
MTTNELFEEVKQITQQNIQTVREKLINLSDTQKNWKKDPNSWSINEIFSHLNQYAAYYHKAFKRKIEKTRFREPRENFISSPLGRSAWKSMKLGNARNIKRRFKAPRSYNPTLNPELVKGVDVDTFLNGQEELLQIFEAAKSINIRKAKIAISISKIVRLRFGDALLFVVYHNERHMQQALNLMGHSKFPTA